MINTGGFMWKFRGFIWSFPMVSIMGNAGTQIQNHHSSGFPCDFHGIFMDFPWISHGISMDFPGKIRPKPFDESHLDGRSQSRPHAGVARGASGARLSWAPPGTTVDPGVQWNGFPGKIETGKPWLWPLKKGVFPVNIPLDQSNDWGLEPAKNG